MEGFIWTKDNLYEFMNSLWSNDKFNKEDFKKELDFYIKCVYIKPKEKKEYEILSFNHKSETYTLTNDGNYGRLSFINPASLNHVPKKAEIISVKRLSDDEVFTVGDRVKYNGEKCYYENFTIDNFFITNYNKCLARGKDNAICEYITEIRKVNQTLFTTEDGIEITDENQTLYAVLTKAQWETKEDTIKRVNERSQFSKPLNTAWKYFSTDEVRLHYIIRNKPSLSWNDVFNLFRDNGSSTSKFLDAVFEKSKSKITNP